MPEASAELVEMTVIAPAGHEHDGRRYARGEKLSVPISMVPILLRAGAAVVKSPAPAPAPDADGPMADA